MQYQSQRISLRPASLLIPAALVIALRISPSALAHHSTAPYDLIHGTIIDGTVAKFEWASPHSQIYLDVPADDTIEPWVVEIDSPAALTRLGWTKNTLKPGDKITITGNRAKDGSFHLRGVYVQFRDGRKLMALPGPDQ